MNNLQHKLTVLIFAMLTVSLAGSAQQDPTDELRYEVNRVVPYIVISTDELWQARTVSDLDPRYKASWVREYLSVEIEASQNGIAHSAVGEGHGLSQEQRDLIYGADAGSEISVKVNYLPENSLRHNDPKEIDFRFVVDPEVQASFAGGAQLMEDYLLEHAIGKIPVGSFQDGNLAAVKFTIDKSGQITNPHLFWSSDDEAVDALLLEAISNMPDWLPATYADGSKASQEFALTVGNMESCAINLLNIRHN